MIVEHNAGFFERGQDIVNLFHETDANSDITGDWLKFRDYTRVAVLLIKGGSEDVDELGLQFLQGTSAAGAGSKTLNFPANGRVWYKTGTWTSQGTWTAVAASTSTIDGLAFGDTVPTGFTRIAADVNTSPFMLVAEIQATDLDADNGFSWFTTFIEGDNGNNSCLMSAWAIFMGAGYAQPVPLSCIA